MNNRLKRIIVILSQDTREDEAQRIINKIRMIEGVQQAEPIKDNVDNYITEARVN